MALRPRQLAPKRAALGRLDVFSAFSDAELDSLCELAQLRHYARGRTLVRQGDLTDAAFGIVSGKLRVSLSRADGSEATLTLLGQGELVGELALFQDGSRSAHVTALEDACVLTIGKSAFLGALKRSPAASLELCRLLASRVRQLAQHFEEVTAVPVEQRLARKLIFLAARWGAPTTGGVGISLTLSQQELAELVDTSRQSANKCLTKWRRAGVLATSARKMVILDVETLRRCGAS
jgi:CRP/FNR family transcriptional regulator